MQLAYNQTLDIMIKATDYKGGIFDDFKLCCPCCGERVEYIQDLGGGRLPHFRHRHASYREDCELYASSDSIYFTGRRAGLKKQGDNASLYFQDNGHAIGFSIGITLSEERFAKCLASSEVLSIKVGEKDKKIPIDDGHFIPKRETLIPIDSDGETIIVAFGKLQEKVDFLPKNKTAIFQVRDKAGFNEGGLLAKRVEKGAKVYYGEKYVFIYPQKLYIGEFIKKGNEKLIFGKYKVIYGEFKENSGAAEEFCKNNDYRLSQAKEKLTVLWPPMRRENEDNLVDGKTIYIATNFELEKDLTTNAMASKEETYWSVRMDSNIKIAAGCIFEQFYPITNKILAFEELDINHVEVSKIQAQENTYLFSSYGVELLEEGTWHVLSDVRYKGKEKTVIASTAGNINVISRTNRYPLPAKEIFQQEVLSRSKEARDLFLSGVVDINFYKEAESYYSVGIKGSGMNTKIIRAPHLYKIDVIAGQNIMGEILSTLSVTFVKYKSFTVLPYPIKYLNEYIQMLDEGLKDGCET